MQQVLLFVLLGLGSGALIACIALAVVLAYRGAGIINLASGAALRSGRKATSSINRPISSVMTKVSSNAGAVANSFPPYWPLVSDQNA